MHLRPSLTRPAVLLALALALAWGGGPQAEATELVYLGQPAGTAAAGQALVTLAGYAADADTTAPRHLLEAFPAGLAAPIGAVGVKGCGGDSLDAATYRASLDRAYQATMDLQDSRPTLAAIRDSQACLTEIMPPEDLAYPSFLEGVLEVSDGDPDAAHEAFQAVFAVHIDYEWDATYPPDAQNGFSRALADVARCARFEVEGALGEDVEIWLDGVPLGGGVTEAVAGRHLLQIRRGAGSPLQGLVLHVEDDVRIIDPADLGMAGSLPVEWLPTALESVTGLLRTRGVGGDDTFVVYVGAEPGVWFWDPEEGRLDPLSKALAMGARRPSGRGSPPRALAPVLLGIGAGLSVAGGLIAGIGWDDLQSFNTSVGNGELGPFPGPDHPDPESVELYGSWQRKVRTVDAGLVMLAGGGVTMAVSLPIGLAAGKGPRQVTLAARLRPARAPHAVGLDGFAFTLSIR